MRFPEKCIFRHRIILTFKSTYISRRVLKDCPRGREAAISIQRGLIPSTGGGGNSPSSKSSSSTSAAAKFKREGLGALRPKSGFLFRSKTPTAELYSSEKEKVPNRPKTPLVDTR